VKQFCIRAAEAEPGINTSYEVVMSTSKGGSSATSLVVPVLDRGELVALI
jgi:hypothetical protein